MLKNHLDKICHLAVAALVAIVVAGVLFMTTNLNGADGLSNATCALIGGAVAIIIGIGKEVYDDRNGGWFDFLDLVCDIFGAGVGVLIVQLFE